MNLYKRVSKPHDCPGETCSMGTWEEVTLEEALRSALTCQTCGGSGSIRCLDCVDGIPRQWIETVADILDVSKRGTYDTLEEASMAVLVALRDREEPNGVD